MPGHRHLIRAALVLTTFAGAAGSAEAGTCWQRPTASTVEELAHVVINDERGRGVDDAKPAWLALSEGDQKIAFGAGYLVGWGETRRRPNFAVVTAVGRSALLAPFAFIGAAGDAKLIELENCSGVVSWKALADRAADLIDPVTLGEIERRQDAGERLMIAVPGSPTRRETVWDLGAIAASRDPDKLTYIRSILRAAVDPIFAFEAGDIPIRGAGRPVMRNGSLRKIGAGEAFLWPVGLRASPLRLYLVHNGVLFPDESFSYLEVRRKEPGIQQQNMALFPALDFLIEATNAGASFRFTSVRPQLNIAPAQSVFDVAYARALFLFAYRQGRMEKEWRADLPGFSN